MGKQAEFDRKLNEQQAKMRRKHKKMDEHRNRNTLFM